MPQPIAVRPDAGPAASGLDLRGSLLDSIQKRLEHYFVPGEGSADGSIDLGTLRTRNLRMVGLITGVVVAVFIPSMALGGVPTDRWPTFFLGVVVAACVI